MWKPCRLVLKCKVRRFQSRIMHEALDMCELFLLTTSSLGDSFLSSA